jgi:protocatechuate 3,4-dioxygenase beta subunit
MPRVRTRPLPGAIVFLLCLAPGSTAQQVIPLPPPAGPPPSMQTFGAAMPALGGPPSLPTGTGRISGRITGSNGQPLRHATVRVNALTGAGTKSTMTDADGRYELRELPAGRFNVTAAHASHISMSYGQRRPDYTPRVIELAASQVRERVDLVLARGGVIAGRLLDEYGEPVADAQVTPMQKRFSQGQVRAMATGRMVMTNDIGEFRIFGLSPGQYMVSARARSSMNPFENVDVKQGYAPTYYPGTPNLADAQPIAVGLGEVVSGIELSLIPARVASVSGVAIDAQGAPVPRGIVTVVESSGGGTAFMPGGPILPDGTFTIRALPPGEYVLRASVASGSMTAMASAAADSAIYMSAGSEPLVARVTVNGSDVSGVVLSPMKKVTIAGRVTVDATSGAAVPAESVRIFLVPRSPEAATMPMTPAPQLNQDLTFELSAPAAELGLRVNVTSQEFVLKAIRVRGIDITDTGVDLRSGNGLDEVEIELTNRPPELSGSVVNTRGEVLTNATVVVFPEDRDRWIFESRLIATVRPSTQDGRFRLRTLPPGRYLAAALEQLQPTTQQDPAFLENLRPRAVAFSLSDGQATTVDLKVAGGR